MPDPNEPEVQVTPATPSQETTPESSAPAAAQATPPAGEPTEESISLKQAKKLRQEAQALRDRLAEAEDKARKLEEAQMSDSERRDKRLADMETKYTALEQAHREASVRYGVAIASQKLGVVDPEVVAALIKPSDLKYDEQGNATNVVELVQDLIEDKPFLRATTQQAPPATPPAAGAVTNPASQNPSNPNSPTVGLPTSFEDYLQRKNDIATSLKNGTLV